MSHANGNGKPPHDPDAEVRVLSSELVLQRIDPTLTADDFFVPQNIALFRAMRSVVAAGKPLDTGLVSDALKADGSWELIGESAGLFKVVASEATGAHLPHYVEAIRAHRNRRDLWKLGHKLIDESANSLPPPDILDAAEWELGNVKKRIAPKGGPRTMAETLKLHKGMRPYVLHGLLRIGEVLNLIAASKTGKSWLVYLILLSIITGKRLFGLFAPSPGRCLLIDNELHRETLDDRIPRVAEALGINPSEYVNDLDTWSLRGCLKDINAISRDLADVKPGTYKVVVIDSLYRALPPDCDENSNSDMAAVYNTLDALAQRLECSIICIHHSSKGSQSHKSVTDTGSGAGAISRAADTHLILRPHAQPNAVVGDAATRSWAQIDPFCLIWNWPLWTLAPHLDPADLRPDRPKRERKAAPDDAPAEKPWTAESFVAKFVTAEPLAKLAIVDNACGEGLSQTTAEKLLKRAAAKKLVHPWQSPDDRRVVLYATVKQPETVKEKPAESAV